MWNGRSNSLEVRMRDLLFAACVAAIALGGPGCKGGEDRTAERQRQLEAARAALAQKETEPAARAPASAPKDPYWDADGALVIQHEKACPDGLWALFPGRAPGGDDEARKQNEARRAELARELRGKTFVARLRGPSEVTLQEYDAPKGHFPLDVKGVIDCEDSIGRVTFALAGARAIDPGASAISPNAIVQSIWQGPPKSFQLPMKGVSEAKGFRQKHALGMESWVVFRVGKTDVHHKKIKVPKVTNNDVSIGGTTDDFGAGRIVFAEVEGVRVVANPGPVVLVDTRHPSRVQLE
jgi:hypothetical protein